MKNLGQALIFGREYLAKSREAARDACLLLSLVLGKPTHYPYLHPEEGLRPDEFESYRRLLERRRSGEPVAYIRGSQEFMGYDFLVDRRVLIPRPETEILVEEAIRFGTGVLETAEQFSFADVCCGSGAIGISVVKEMSQRLPDGYRKLAGLKGFLTDISQDALDVAKLNAQALGADEHVIFLQGDLCEPLSQAGLSGRLDLVMSNPPYIESSEMQFLPVEVRHEPSLALDGGEDGLATVRRLVAQAPDLLRPGGKFLMEIGATQGEDCLRLMAQAGCWEDIRVIPDLAGFDRVVRALKK